jgi:uncharacterized integral membrane protein
MTAPKNYRDLPAPVEEPNRNGRSNAPVDVPLSPSDRIRVPRSRIGELWIAAVAFALVLLVLLIFVLENGQRAEVSFFGAHGHLPEGVALLLAAVFGVLLVALPGSARIVQLRLLERRRRRSPETTPTPVLDADIPLSHDTENHPR